MQAIWTSGTQLPEQRGFFDALKQSGSPFSGMERDLFSALSSFSLPENASLLFQLEIDGEIPLPLVLLAGDRVVLFDICTAASAPVLCAKADRLASVARRLSLFHKGSDGLRVHCALLVTGREKLKPYSVHICQVLPFGKLADYLRSLTFEGQTPSPGTWLESEAKDGREILADRIDAGLAKWSRFVLDGWVNDAAEEMAKLHKMGYRLYLTTDYASAKAYCTARYEHTDALYGFITSSDAENMLVYGGPKGGRVRRIEQPEDAGWQERWFDRDSPDGGRTFRRAATEDMLLGERLDFAVLGWGDDMRWVGKWKTRGAGATLSLDIGLGLSLTGRHRPKHEPDAIDIRGGLDIFRENPRLGAYHTLLTAPREGLVLFTISDLYVDSARNALMRCGAEKMF